MRNSRIRSPNILLLVFLFAFIFFHCRSVHLAGRSLLAASISHFLWVQTSKITSKIFSHQKHLELRVVSYLLIELFYIGMPVVRTCGHVITKISRVDWSLRFGAPLARASCARGAPLLKEIVGASAMTPLLTTLTSQKSLSSVPTSASLPFVVLSILQSTACKGATGFLACKLPWCLVTCTVYHSAAGLMFSSTFRRCTFMVFNVLEIEPETWRIVRC